VPLLKSGGILITNQRFLISARMANNVQQFQGEKKTSGKEARESEIIEDPFPHPKTLESDDGVP
jgi:hypothetical protein